VKKLKSGLVQAVVSTLIGLILTTIVGLCAKQGWIPSYSPLALTIVNVILNIITINKMRRWGIFYTFGWLAGSLAFKALGLMDTTDLIFNIMVPMAVLLIRLVLWFRSLLPGSASR
jgi:hypothetical protein